MRYIEVTHTYVIPVPAEDVRVIEPLAREGMSIMEGFMMARAENITDLRSDWKMMPSSYRPVQPVQELVEATPQSIADAVMENSRVIEQELIQGNGDQDVDDPVDVPGVVHPWDQGARVTPPGHELFDAETEALRQEGRLCGNLYPGSKGRRECVLVSGHIGAHLYRDVAETREIDA